MVYRSFSSDDTKKFAAGFAKDVVARSPRQARSKPYATVIALQGDLGAGKTTFVQGFFKGLGIRRVPNSPTFIVMRRTPLRAARAKAGARAGQFKNVYHVDAYRIRDPKDLAPLGFKELLADPANLFLIEWPEQIAGALPKQRTTIVFSHDKTPDTRMLRIARRALWRSTL